jgi:hypothetical protein
VSRDVFEKALMDAVEDDPRWLVRQNMIHHERA